MSANIGHIFIYIVQKGGLIDRLHIIATAVLTGGLENRTTYRHLVSPLITPTAIFENAKRVVSLLFDN